MHAALLLQTFHGEKELFLSDHFDWCSLKTVMTKCRVLSLPKYQELKKIEDADFYARFTYRVRSLKRATKCLQVQSLAV